MTTTIRTPQVIRSDESYTVAEFRLRTAMGDFVFRQLRSAGFPIIQFGKKRYILGADWIEWLAREREKQFPGKTKNEVKR